MEEVALVSCNTYDEADVGKAIGDALEHLGGLEQFIKPGMKVLIKPNLLMRKKPNEAGTTHPSLVKAIALKVISLGAEVTIADSPGGFYNEGILKSVYAYCGYKEIPEQTGAKLNFDTSMVEVSCENGKVSKKLTVIKPVTEADFIINVPKLKTHGMMVFTGAIKNLFGLIPGTLKAEYHLRLSNYNDFSNLLVDICERFRPDLTIMDAIEGMEGPGPSAGTPRHIGAIIAGTNPYMIDIVATNMIGLRPEQVFTLIRASERGLPSKLSDVKIIGEDLEAFKIKDYKIPVVHREHILPNNKVVKFLAEYLKPKPIFEYDICIKCKECANHCPPKAISFDTGRPVVDLNKCIRCFCCQELCPKKAIYIKKPWIMRKIVREK
jgi:uncharacterized protein (DUF362 family)/NAD-dependent dihydropyrimidine dehydrogenase PreA subunit